MKKTFFRLAVLLNTFLITTVLASCEKAIIEDKKECNVIVNISSSDFNYEFEEDSSFTRASDKTIFEAGINRISLSVFDSYGELVFKTSKNESVDVDDFSQISCSLSPGDYSFVVVAHKANGNEEDAADISATDKATISTSKLLKTFAVNQSVTVIADQANYVTIDLGKRISSQFTLKLQDDQPEEVVSCQIIMNPAGTNTTDLLFNPSTGLAYDSYLFKNEFQRSVTSNNSFRNNTLALHCLVTENPQNVDIKIIMKDANGSVVKSRTLKNVPMAPHRVTRATGNFFDSSTRSTFLFDLEDDPVYDITLQGE
ncbi:MAG: FimB/Mfa2 family fimbrial subunit [Prevotella sp.]|nr:FimB/Mfa2 family fimbrial subunit [Prevotella sp.]